MERRFYGFLAFFAFGFIFLVSGEEGRCDASNSGVVERAFGPVITTKLEAQTEAIKESIDSGFEEQNQKDDERFEAIQSGMEDQTKEMSRQFLEQSDAILPLVESSLNDQTDKLLEQTEAIKDSLRSGFVEQNEKNEQVLQLLESQRQFFEQKLQEQEEHTKELLTKIEKDWVLVEDSFIYVETDPDEKATFEDASKKCQEMHQNAQLYEPPTDEHNDEVHELLTKASHWIGIKKSAEGS